MALVSGGCRFGTVPTSEGGASRDLVGWGRAWGKANGFDELDDLTAGEIGFLFFHAGARTSKDRDADHLVQHARERGHEIKKPAPRSEEPSEEPPTDDQRSAWARALEVEGQGVTEAEFSRAHPESA